MNKNPKDLSKIIRIEVLDLPEHYEPNEGEYEVRIGSSPKEPAYYDIITLDRWLRKICPNIAIEILDRLQNFRLAYLNLGNGEITS